MKSLVLITATMMPILGFVGAEINVAVDSNCAPSGAHLQTGTLNCQCQPNHSVSCNGFQLCGVGKTNAALSLSGTYTATVQCTNPGGNVVEAHSNPTTSSKSGSAASTKNGCMVVSPLAISQPSDADFEAQATCPNGKWSKSVESNTVALSGFTYTFTFAGFPSTCPYITITGC
ncbi:uncharacterized protein TRIVIDRAFT_70311 [Trichoderma virens Gv29-8]|uniref:Secreted protein n=1 Tax=Hypocrea virens (strain Gv29-8 / FGSC 10586) TaxID=413071 RepID=G9MW38_HYPVG|nr:uncharacterized protein TRIVIDRAFT_70311 [Trichoderma virens Gv29-8]EHK21334.1 hypothetical protein TRIVIDRAFT_70311 [Trichoderma virens Gv29-8]UKZ47126.1 hypothetical protein TrVGV298_001340 [Trichoderma virens]